MSTYTDQPFSDYEERYFLAEILKRSNLPPTALMNLIQEYRIEPVWDEIALPNGRSVSSCKSALTNLSARILQQHHQQQQQQQHPQQTYIQQTPPAMMDDVQYQRPQKRPYSMSETTSTPVGRDIRPRPPLYNTVNSEATPSSAPTIEPPRKKRGRPTKAEHEKRSAEASARGEVWPKPRSRPKPRRTSEPNTIDSKAGIGSGSVEDSGEETSMQEMTRPTAASSGNTLTSVMNSPIQSLPSTSRSNLQDVIQPAGQVNDEEGRHGSLGRPETGISFFHSQPITPRMSGPAHVPPFSPQLGQQFQPTEYRSPTTRQ